jgi:hypothetical protein
VRHVIPVKKGIQNLIFCTKPASLDVLRGEHDTSIFLRKNRNCNFAEKPINNVIKSTIINGQFIIYEIEIIDNSLMKKAEAGCSGNKSIK